MDRRALNTEVKDLLATGLRLSVAPAEIGEGGVLVGGA